MSHARIISRLNLALGLFVTAPAAAVAPSAMAQPRTMIRIGSRVPARLPADPARTVRVGPGSAAGLRVPARVTQVRK